MSKRVLQTSALGRIVMEETRTTMVFPVMMRMKKMKMKKRMKKKTRMLSTSQAVKLPSRRKIQVLSLKRRKSTMEKDW